MCDLATLVWSQVQKEPIVCEAHHDDLSSGDTLVADLRVCGVWQPQVDVLRAVDTDALLGLFCILLRLRSDGSTLLLVMIIGLDLPAGYFMRRLVDALYRKWEKPYRVVMSFVRASLSFVILRASMLCMRGVWVEGCTGKVENFQSF